ncbi:hypothetical protein CFE70_006736 [Pyrenophora teres f. teres 0-1]|uniref:Cerato-platanin domain containing protein n=2 Tax=Pyrenophora teres f. teres TaxID=97479 RepID=E3RT43_PYRTT|nr:hypothetical protein [Acinetobacter baumannii]EFQ91084.1 hypothetical protein PTT_12150 [Pyrenophora teres f. teres 0-1]KAE8826395.1 hypothetical protein HRS9122_09897 [Pyrenophora teres f. teres]CAA9963306.1 Cerato-platanin domain containing protein [Pyrenophora teres f. maculata]KAE8828349.1 hypothetical protein HRS9139_07568 [Pyrenophora teres f. teres]KAE8830949.1 hypothetical protein PTNB85_07536 [Pyrenophora teres f. teres]
MKFTAAILSLASMASAITVSYDTIYDDSSRSMTTVSCSDGENGLIRRYGFQTLGAIKNFPYVGGYQGVEGWNSKQCGTCYSVTYNGNTIYVLAIDRAGAGFNLAKGAVDKLTNNQAEALGRIDAQYAQVGVNMCGL